MNFPADLKYTKDHEWIRVDGNVAYVGITDYDRCRDKNRKETVYAGMAGNDIPFSTEYCREYDCRNKRRPFRSANRGWSFSVV